MGEKVQYKMKIEMNCSKWVKKCSSKINPKWTAPNRRKSAVQN